MGKDLGPTEMGRYEKRSVVKGFYHYGRLLLFLGVFLGGGSGGKAWGAGAVRVELLVEPSALMAGAPFFAAVRMSHDPGWHTYYKEPGDSGVPTQIQWVLPEGFSAGEILWPAPKKFVVPPFVDFGYEGDVALLVSITPPATLTVPQVTLAARVSWLECKDVCVPGKAEVSVVVPVAQKEGAPTKAMGAFFDQARKRLEIFGGASPPGFLQGSLGTFWARVSQWGAVAGAVLFAFLGGIILNFMPCVLPVLSIKFIGFVEAPRGMLRRHGMLYAVGVLLSFLLLAGVLLFLRAGGEKLGWGFQLQSPIFVGFMAALFLLLGLNLWGVFEVGTSLTRLGGLLGGASASNAFWSGALAVLVATPCTAPFMGSALGYALTQPAAVSFAIFFSMGTGMALPYVLLSFFPGALRWIPKPGAWMGTLKKGLSLLFFGTTLWLLWVLTIQLKPPRETSFSPAQVQAFLDEGKRVFVDFTAAWCITCQVNERTTLSTKKVKRALADNRVEFLVADWTHRDPVISQSLEQFGRSGVPLYVLYVPGRDPLVLPTILTPDLVVDAVSQ